MDSTLQLINIFRFIIWAKFVVITGGPCGGKSTFLKMAINLLSKHGKKVIVIPEVARELIGSGIRPWDLWKQPTSFQKHVLMAILEKEARYFQSVCDMGLQEGQEVIFLCDRGLLDGIAYMGEEAFTNLLSEIGISFADALDRYAGVIALVSAANGAEKFYVNDDERVEPLEQAKIIDNKTIEAWFPHQHLSIIDNSTDFPTKINNALLALKRILKLPMAEEIEKKYLVRNFNPNLIPSTAVSYGITQVYLCMPHKPGIECRVRKKTTNGEDSYYYTEKTSTEVEGVRGENEEQITKDRYNELIGAYGDMCSEPVEKTRFKFRHGSYMLELDVYQRRLNGLVTLEAELKTPDELATFVPPDQFDLEDVTADSRYSNRMLAQCGIPKEKVA